MKDPKNHCTPLKDASPAAAATSHHTRKTMPIDQTVPVMRCVIDSAEVICSMS